MYRLRSQCFSSVQKTVKFTVICTYLDKLKDFSTLNELQGRLGEQLTKFVAHINILEMLVIQDIIRIDSRSFLLQS